MNRLRSKPRPHWLLEWDRHEVLLARGYDRDAVRDLNRTDLGKRVMHHLFEFERAHDRRREIRGREFMMRYYLR